MCDTARRREYDSQYVPNCCVCILKSVYRRIRKVPDDLCIRKVKVVLECNVIPTTECI